MNQLVLTAQLVARGALRYTPAGLPALDLSLKHESSVVQDGKARLVTVEIKAKAIGGVTKGLGDIELGSPRRFSGFLGSQRNGRGVVFHVTEFE